MNDEFTCTLNNLLTEEEWDMISDVDFDRTERVWFHTKHGKDVEFAKVRHGRWKGWGMGDYCCTQCGMIVSGNKFKYCPYCGAKMDDERR